jgi:enoyl-CoA hydratase/carnithine racemase
MEAVMPPIAELTVGDGRKRNALTVAAWEELERRVREVGAADDVRVVVVRGRGGTFCAGSDINEWAGATPEFVEESFARMESAFRAIEQCPVPVVAEIHGDAAGAGCQLALACDLRFMAASARIGMPIARLGILASPAFAARLITAAGPAVAGELLYTGGLLDAPDAVASGLANRAFPDSDTTTRVEEIVASIAAQPTAAVRAAKRAVGVALAPIRETAARNDSPAVSYSDFDAAVRKFLGPR